jgi:hypothetical protein
MVELNATLTALGVDLDVAITASTLAVTGATAASAVSITAAVASEGELIRTTLHAMEQKLNTLSTDAIVVKLGEFQSALSMSITEQTNTITNAITAQTSAIVQAINNIQVGGDKSYVAVYYPMNNTFTRINYGANWFGFKSAINSNEALEYALYRLGWGTYGDLGFVATGELIVEVKATWCGSTPKSGSQNESSYMGDIAIVYDGTQTVTDLIIEIGKGTVIRSALNKADALFIYNGHSIQNTNTQGLYLRFQRV